MDSNRIRQAAARLHAVSLSMGRLGVPDRNIRLMSELLGAIGEEIDHAIGDGDYYYRASWEKAGLLSEEILR